MILKFLGWILHQNISDTYLFKCGLAPVVELCPFLRAIMKFCNYDISKTVTASSCKLGQLIEEEMSRLPGEN